MWEWLKRLLGLSKTLSINWLDEDALPRPPSSPGIMFCRQPPAPLDKSCLSFFGGLPITPADFQWPTSPYPAVADGSSGVSFLGQIDMATLPDSELRGLLPSQGILYFFFDWQIPYFKRVDGGHTVQYHNGDAASFQETSAPDDLHILHYKRYSSEQNAWFRFHKEGSLAPKAFLKTRITSAVIDTYEISHPGYEGYHRPENLGLRLRDKSVFDAFGPYSEPPPPPPDDGGLAFPCPRFPQAWLYVDHVADEILHRLGTVIGQFEDDKRAARNWIEKARAQGVFSAIPASERGLFRS
ncbi:hypothetical protein ABI_28300 [Asticcacaulis biprosthecium C19]|uniref:Uncharacterized protein n=1 Tax=Asticcacaulis biprosthecium C19 TaxID=715226 RepID=F4QMH3_9CAUL|nr:DUF1963 domain-containing protein [Asticcacaulis biprosthecium]EGF91414.1 hypothetical protein ABI_28300 [Asticcacaulis biprosthecium C19]